MGGSGGNSSFGTFGPSDRREISCDLLRFRAAVISPDLKILSTLSVGDRLKVALDSNQAITVITPTGQVLGGLLPGELGRLIQCILNGTGYEARIVEITSPRCVVDVYPV